MKDYRTNATKQAQNRNLILKLKKLSDMQNITKLPVKDLRKFAKEKYNVGTILSNGMTNTKTAKNDLKTFILYMTPHKRNSKGVNVCPNASVGCALACLDTSGRGVFKNVQEARTNKIEFYLNYKERFLNLLAYEIKVKIATAKKRGEKIAFRLNGTTDLDFIYLLKKYANLDLIGMPGVFLYDYTKTLGKALKYQNSSNYVHTFSRSESNQAETKKAIEAGLNVAVVFANELPDFWQGIPVVNGDKGDDLMLNYKGVILGLKAKGKARKDTSGFVVTKY